jgi:hypothetical protein
MNKQGRSPALHPPIAPSSIEVSKDITFDLRFKNPTKILFLLRYFLTKSLVRGNKLEKWEEASMFLLYTECSQIKDPNFHWKHGVRWLTLHQVFSIWKKGEKARERSDLAKLRIFLSNNFFLSPRAFLGQEIPVERKVLKRLNRRLKKCPPPLRRIGVGYKDKGNAKFVHLDGSPSWQNVFASLPEIEREKAPPILKLKEGWTLTLETIKRFGEHRSR